MTEKRNNNDAAFAVGGAALGVGLATLLKKPGASPPDTISLLEQILAAVKAIAIPADVYPASFLTPWKAQEPVHIFEQAIRNVGVFQSDIMVDMRNIKRLAIRAESSLDQAVTIQLIGNFSESFTLPINVGPPAACPINGQVGFGLAWGDWQPYIGVLITAAVAPTIGLLNIWAVAQE